MTTSTGNPAAGFPGSIDIDGVLVYPASGDPTMWFYVPGDPVPELTNGKPALQFFATRNGGILQLGARWAVDAAAMERIKAQIGEKLAGGQTDGGRVRLQPAPASVREVSLEAGDGQGKWTQVAAAKSSGFPPYTTLFRLPVTREAQEFVTGAFNGREQLLGVRYRVAAQVRVSAAAAVEGDIAAAMRDLSPGSTKDEIRAWVNAARETGRVRVDVHAPEGGEALLHKVVAEAEAAFVDALQAKLRGPEAAAADESRLRVEQTVSDVVERDLERFADVTHWFGPGGGQQFMTVA